MAHLDGHRILIVNDDGIQAPGIQLLERLARQHTDDVWVVAPNDERSGASNSISMHVPVRVRQLDDRHFAVAGTPTDCVLVALYELMPQRPTLVLSGVNRGANLAEDVHYSGTFAAAMEAVLQGVPAVALSQIFTQGGDVHWDTAEKYTLPVIECILEAGLEHGGVVNVNFPDVPASEVTGVEVVELGRRPPGTFKTDGRLDCRDIPYYWVRLDPQLGGEIEGTDLGATHNGAVAICPVRFEMTDRVAMEKLKQTAQAI